MKFKSLWKFIETVKIVDESKYEILIIKGSFHAETVYE